eukprot:TRINITY_DN26965_c0_g3_i1.p1 TRINITY_DN26965_c0_g3~~TRINITY_DN26965_c0_g3_i1.p1  ORF type:complete len:685 (-),score=148.73 TRINITY_DN26965_c0_g3_i1:66-2120(-)
MAAMRPTSRGFGAPGALGAPGAPGRPSPRAPLTLNGLPGGRSACVAAGSALVGRASGAGMSSTPRDDGFGKKLSARSTASDAHRISGSSTTTSSMALVRAMKGTNVQESLQDSSRIPQGSPAYSDDGAGSDDNRSVCSAASNMSTSSVMNGTNRTKHGKSRTGSRSLHMSFDGCSVEIEAEDDLSKFSALTDFAQLGGDGGHCDGLTQCLQMYGYESPNKMQQRVIPAVMHFMGRQLGGAANACGKGKSCIMVQGPEKTGKTSAVVIALLAAIDPTVPMPQVILVASSPSLDIDKYLRLFTLMQSVTCASFNWEEGHPTGGDIDETSPEVRAARKAHILVGHPRRMLKLISSVPSLCLDAVKVVVIDDADDMMLGVDVATEGAGREDALAALTASAASPSAPSSATLGLESSDGAAAPPAPASPMEDYVQLTNVIECRQYSQNMSDTMAIRAGHSAGLSVRHVLITKGRTDSATKKAIRLLKNSLMKKKAPGMSSAPPAKLIKSMKHYFAAAPRSEWSRVFAGLVQSLMFPRAVIFCDGQDIGLYVKELEAVGITVSANAPGLKPGESAADARRRAVQEFTSGKTQFLLTTSEHAICQIMLPKVSCVFHFGVPTDVPSTYGLRLMPIDPKAMKESSSILLVEAGKKMTAGMPATVNTLGKLFDINFTDMPWEFLPTTASLAGKR